MTALEFHREHPTLEFAPVLRVIKYTGLDSNALHDDDVARILQLYPHFESDPELVVGAAAVCEHTELEAEELERLLTEHRAQIPYLGSPTHPMVPGIGLRMIRAVAAGNDPWEQTDQDLYTLTEMSEKTGISLASLSKYLRDHPDRIPSQPVGKMRKFPSQAVDAFRRIKMENLGRRAGGRRQVQRQKAAVNRRFATRFAELEEQVDAAVEVSKSLAKTLSGLSRQVRRARIMAESGAKIAPGHEPGRPRRSGSQRPDTIVATCKRVLTEAPGPMRVADITERVIALGAEIRAKNPNVTVSSILSSYADFTRVKRGYYELAEPQPGAESVVADHDVDAIAGLPTAS